MLSEGRRNSTAQRGFEVVFADRSRAGVYVRSARGDVRERPEPAVPQAVRPGAADLAADAWGFFGRRCWGEAPLGA